MLQGCQLGAVVRFFEDDTQGARLDKVGGLVVDARIRVEGRGNELMTPGSYVGVEIRLHALDRVALGAENMGAKLGSSLDLTPPRDRP